MEIKNKKDININVGNHESSTNHEILILILKELKDINKNLTRHDVIIDSHENRIQKLEERL